MGSLARFGEYEADLRAGELRRNGQLLHVQELHFRILALLMERQGEVVTRQEIRERLWPADVFIDFDHAINKGISLLRSQLRDSAESPRYVETVGRRGYRFVAAIESRESEAERRELVAGAGEGSGGHGSAGEGVAVARAQQRSVGSPALAPTPARLLLNPKIWVALVLLGGVLGLVAIARRPAETVGPLVSRPLSSNPGFENMPAFSPDGESLAYVWVGSDRKDRDGIWIRRIDSDTPVQLTHSDSDMTPAWSPDGHRLAFVRRQNGGRFGIYVIGTSGEGERKAGEVTGSSTSLGAIDWSPDGKYLATTDGGERGHQVVLLSVETGEKRALSHPDPGIPGDSRAKFSPDGKQIAFRRSRNSSVEDVYIMPFRGAGGGTGTEVARRLTFDNRGIQGLAWAADGESLIVSSQRVGNLPSLWMIPISGGEPVQLTETGLSAVRPAVSPVGNRLAYVREFTNINMWRLDLSAGKPAERLIASTGVVNSGPQYSPDGSQIAFRSARSGSDEVWISDAGGNRPWKLTNFNGPLTGSPRWSPDGSRLALESRAFGHADIFLVRPDGGELRRFTTEPSNESLPSWSEDGRWIYFTSDRTGSWQVWKQPVDGGAAVQVTRQGGFAAFASPGGEFLYYSKAAPQQGLWRMRLAGGAGREELLLDELNSEMWGNWAMNESGVWFLHYPAEPRPRVARVMFFDPATRARREIAKLEHVPARWDSGLAVSRDSRWLLYAQVDEAGSNIMVVEKFR